MTAWNRISETHAPIGDTVLVANEITGEVFPAYSYWGKAPFPLWCSLHPDGIGRCRPTHWQAMPKFDTAEPVTGAGEARAAA